MGSEFDECHLSGTASIFQFIYLLFCLILFGSVFTIVSYQVHKYNKIYSSKAPVIEQREEREQSPAHHSRIYSKSLVGDVNTSQSQPWLHSSSPMKLKQSDSYYGKQKKDKTTSNTKVKYDVLYLLLLHSGLGIFTTIIDSFYYFEVFNCHLCGMKTFLPITREIAYAMENTIHILVVIIILSQLIVTVNNLTNIRYFDSGYTNEIDSTHDIESSTVGKKENCSSNNMGCLCNCNCGCNCNCKVFYYICLFVFILRSVYVMICNPITFIFCLSKSSYKYYFLFMWSDTITIMLLNIVIFIWTILIAIIRHKMKKLIKNLFKEYHIDMKNPKIKRRVFPRLYTSPDQQSSPTRSPNGNYKIITKSGGNGDNYKNYASGYNLTVNANYRNLSKIYKIQNLSVMIPFVMIFWLLYSISFSFLDLVEDYSHEGVYVLFEFAGWCYMVAYFSVSIYYIYLKELY